MKKPARQLPSEHEIERQRASVAQSLEEEARRRKEGQLRQAVDFIHTSEQGRIFWAYLYDVCGFSKSSLSRLASGDIAPLSTECKEAQRLLYLNLRKLASPDLLAKTEFFAEHGGGEESTKQKGA